MDRKKPVIKEIERFYRDISLKMPLQKMIFFGSRAKGKANKDSDIDLLLVSSKFKGVRPLSRSPELYLKWDSDYAVDLICLTPKEFNQQKKELGVVQEAIKEGIEIRC
ncbi:MAG: nucleotidyltransferase domain-containing protein [Nanoarchaeota archaeon]